MWVGHPVLILHLWDVLPPRGSSKSQVVTVRTCQVWPQHAEDQLPPGWIAERFKIFDGGDGRVGIKGTWQNQHLGISWPSQTSSNSGYPKIPVVWWLWTSHSGKLALLCFDSSWKEIWKSIARIMLKLQQVVRKKRFERRRDVKRQRERERDVLVWQIGITRDAVFFNSFVLQNGWKAFSVKLRVQKCRAKALRKNCMPAAVARNTFESQNRYKLSIPNYFWNFRCSNIACGCGPRHIWKSELVPDDKKN